MGRFTVETESPLVLTDAVADQGVTGHSTVFTYASAALWPMTKFRGAPTVRKSRYDSRQRKAM